MKNKTPILIIILIIALLGYIGIVSSQTVNYSDSYGILSSTYTDTSGATTVNGDVGFTTLPATAPLGVHTNYGSAAPYSQAGIDQGTTLATLNALPCDFTFGSAQDLSLLVQPLVAGVYCTTGAQSVGTGGITLISGTYVFRSTGALNTVANSVVSGGDPCKISWTPVATTLGANSTFRGTVIDDAGITVGSTVAWIGRALAFGGTITTDSDTITVPNCTIIPPVVPPVTPTSTSPTTTVNLPQVNNSSGGSGCVYAYNFELGRCNYTPLVTPTTTPSFVPPPQPYCDANPLQCKG